MQVFVRGEGEVPQTTIEFVVWSPEVSEHISSASGVRGGCRILTAAEKEERGFCDGSVLNRTRRTDAEGTLWETAYRAKTQARRRDAPLITQV